MSGIDLAGRGVSISSGLGGAVSPGIPPNLRAGVGLSVIRENALSTTARIDYRNVASGAISGDDYLVVQKADGEGNITGELALATVADLGGGGGGGGPANTDALPEGATNLYFTAARARNSISVTGSLSYNSATGVISYTAPVVPANTDGLSEGSTNLYYTNARARNAISATGPLSYNSGTGVLSATLAAVATSGSAADLSAGTLPVARLPAFTGGNVTSTAGSANLTIANSAVTNAHMANMAASTFKGRVTASTGAPEDMTAAQATSLLNAFVGDSGSGGTKGLVPAPATGDATKFLNGAGAWSSPAGAGDVVGPASATNNAWAVFDGTTGKLLKNGSVPAAVASSGSASDLGAGTLPAARLPTSGVSASTYGSATAIPVLTIDATGRVTSATTATVNGGEVSCTVTRGGTDQSNFAVGTSVKVAFNVEEFDNGNCWTGGTFTVPAGQAGRYAIMGQLSFTTNVQDGANHLAYIYKNGSAVKSGGSKPGGINTTYCPFCAVLDLAVSDTIEIYGFCGGTGSNRTLDGDSVASYVSIFKV